MKARVPRCLIAMFCGATLAAHAGEQFQKAREGYQQAIEREVWKKHDAAVADLDAKYATAVGTALATATRDGKLDLAVALRAEKERAEKREPMPTDEATTPAALKDMRQKYRGALEKLEATRDAAKKPIQERYIQTLKALESELTKANDLDGALEARTEREKLEGQAGPVGSKDPSAIWMRARPAEVSKAGLVDRRLAFGKGVGRGKRFFMVSRLGEDGSIIGTGNPKNEARWDIDGKGHLVYLGQAGKVTSVFNKVTWDEGRVEFRGDSQLGDGTTEMFLLELKPLPLKPGMLTANRLAKNIFQFVTIVPVGTDHHSIQFQKDGTILNAQFTRNPTWEVDKEGRLLVKGGDGGEPIVFGTAFSFDKGNNLVLLGSSKSDPERVVQLMENPDGK